MMIAKYVNQDRVYDLSDEYHISNQPEYRKWIYEYALKKFEYDTEYKKCTGICAEIVKYIRVASRQSTTFDLIISPQNMKNISKINKTLK